MPNFSEKKMIRSNSSKKILDSTHALATSLKTVFFNVLEHCLKNVKEEEYG